MILKPPTQNAATLTFNFSFFLFVTTNILFLFCKPDAKINKISEQREDFTQKKNLILPVTNHSQKSVTLSLKVTQEY